MNGRGNERALDAVLLDDVPRNHSSRGDVRMMRRVGAVLAAIAALAALAGCAYQNPFGLPDLTPQGAQPSVQVYPGYGYGYGTGYPNGYPLAYGYGDPYYAGQGPYPHAYGYGYAYGPTPRYNVVPCADNNRDGRCDTRPPKKHHERDQDGGDHDGDDRPARPRRDYHGEVPRVRDRASHDVAPTAQQRPVPAPAPFVQPPMQARPEPRRATPPEAANQRGPRAGRGRPSTTGDDVVSSRPTQEP